MFKEIAPLVAIVIALVITVFSLFGSGGFAHVSQLNDRLNTQVEKNAKLKYEIEELKDRVYKLKRDDRVLEREARDELGLSRDGELVFFFDDAKDDDPK